MSASWTNTHTDAAGDRRDLTGLTKLALETGQQFAEPKMQEPVHYALVPGDSTILSLEDYQFPDGRRPAHVSQVLTLHDVNSFNGYVNGFKDERTRVFADRRSLTLTAIIDYHHEQPEFLVHQARLPLALDPRWKTWADADGRSFTQVEFAEFLEDNSLDIVRPTAAAMLETARDLHMKTDVTFDSRVSLDNGTIQMGYSETTKGGIGKGKLDIPQTFDIAVPVFRGEPLQTLTVRLRYRLGQANVTFSYRMYRKDDILQAAFERAVAAVAAVAGGIGIDVLMGATS